MDDILAIQAEQQFLDQNHLHMQQKYRECLRKYTEHLEEEIEQLEAAEPSSNSHHSLIGSLFRLTYEQIAQNSFIALHKIRDTYQAKSRFWEDTLKQNADIEDLEIKKKIFSQQIHCENLRFEALKRASEHPPPYRVFLNKKMNGEALRECQIGNKNFEFKATQGSLTPTGWNWRDQREKALIANQVVRGNRTISTPERPNEEFIDNFLKIR